MSGANRNGRLFWGTAILVVIVDLITKIMMQRHLIPHMPMRVIGDYVRFTLAYNPGAAFSMSLGPASRYVFGAFAVVALIVLWRLYRDAKPTEWLKVLALGLAWGGAAGNLVDRFRSPRGVVDFLDIGVGNLRFWTFNVADSAVTIGAILLGWVLLQEDRAGSRERRGGGEAADGPGAPLPAPGSESE
ncbi:MAG TPA: signal peptidase II [Gemmatimonadaceae bacterium]|nr:signal peptidase II [Gemmatimonadaceae bacterium]